jgi:hypothetical protein
MKNLSACSLRIQDPKLEKAYNESHYLRILKTLITLCCIKLPFLIFLVALLVIAHDKGTLNNRIFYSYIIFAFGSLFLQILLIPIQIFFKRAMTRWSVLIWLFLNVFHVNPIITSYPSASYSFLYILLV